eukprot:g19834.t1
MTSLHGLLRAKPPPLRPLLRTDRVRRVTVQVDPKKVIYVDTVKEADLFHHKPRQSVPCERCDNRQKYSVLNHVEPGTFLCDKCFEAEYLCA